MNLFNLFENEHTRRNRAHTVRGLFDRWTNSEYAPFNSDSGDYNEVIRKAASFLQDIVDPSQVERLALKLSDYWHGEDGTELDEKLGSQLVNRRQAHALITKFKRHSFGEDDASGSEGAGVFAVGDTVLFKGHSAEVIEVDGTAATIRVPNWKNVSGMVDDTTEVDPASHFLELVPHDVSEAGMSDQHKENHLAAVRAYHAKKKADKEQQSADSRGAFNNWMGGSPEDQTDFMNIRKKGVAEGKKVDRFVGYVEKSEEKAGKSKKDAESIAWATANKRGMLDNKNKKKVKEDSVPLTNAEQITRDMQTMNQAFQSGKMKPKEYAPGEISLSQIYSHPKWRETIQAMNKKYPPDYTNQAVDQPAQIAAREAIKRMIQQGIKEDSTADQIARDSALIAQHMRQRWEAEQRAKQPPPAAPAPVAPAAPPEVQVTPDQIANHPQYKMWYDRFYRKELPNSTHRGQAAGSAKQYTDSKIKSLIQQGTDPNDPGPTPPWVKNLPPAPAPAAPAANTKVADQPIYDNPADAQKAPPRKAAPAEPAPAGITKTAPPEWGNKSTGITKTAPPEWGNAPTGITKTAPPAETDAQRMNRPDMRESKNKSKSMKRAANDSTGPKFGGYYKGTQKGAPRTGQGFGSMEEDQSDMNHSEIVQQIQSGKIQNAEQLLSVMRNAKNIQTVWKMLQLEARKAGMTEYATNDSNGINKVIKAISNKKTNEGIAGNMTVRSDTLTNLKKPEDLTMKTADPLKGNPNRNALVSAQARNLVAKGAQTAGPGTGAHTNKALDVKKGDFRKMKHKGSFDFSESTNFLAWAMASGYNVIGNPAVYESAKYEYNMLLAEVKKKVKEAVDPNAAAPAAAPAAPPAPPPPTPDDNIPDLQPGQYFVWRVYFDDGTKTRMKITDPKFDVNKYYSDKNISVINVDYNWKPHNG
jgi:hypothetical protein